MRSSRFHRLHRLLSLVEPGRESIRAEAEAQVALFDYSAAMDRFKAAQGVVRNAAGGIDHIEASIIDTRARQVQSLLREQALER